MIAKDELRRAAYDVIAGMGEKFDMTAISEVQRLATILWSSVPKAYKILEMGIRIGITIQEYRSNERGVSKV